MSWVALLLIGFGLADLTHSIRPGRIVPECVGAAAVIAVGLLAGLTETADVLALIGIGAAVVVWGQTVRLGFGRDRAWLPLVVAGVALAIAIGFSAQAGESAGLLGDWLTSTSVPVLAGLSPDRALLLLGVLLLQLSTGNVLVRLVLSATDTVNPGRGRQHDASQTLKGGRLLGPMERVFIVGLGLAGHVTAASIVIAAKGLLRFPELQATRDNVGGPNIDEVTEYFLVGSFVSWLISLSSLVLLAG